MAQFLSEPRVVRGVLAGFAGGEGEQKATVPTLTSAPKQRHTPPTSIQGLGTQTLAKTPPLFRCKQSILSSVKHYQGESCQRKLKSKLFYFCGDLTAYATTTNSHKKTPETTIINRHGYIELQAAQPTTVFSDSSTGDQRPPILRKGRLHNDEGKLSPCQISALVFTAVKTEEAKWIVSGAAVAQSRSGVRPWWPMRLEPPYPQTKRSQMTGDG